jgi:hypothetical protein
MVWNKPKPKCRKCKKEIVGKALNADYCKTCIIKIRKEQGIVYRHKNRKIINKNNNEVNFLRFKEVVKGKNQVQLRNLEIRMKRGLRKQTKTDKKELWKKKLDLVREKLK